LISFVSPMQMLTGGTQVLKGCKHMDRCQNRCSEPLRIRGHKRGHLTVECAAGHQWVWCPLCCNCGTKGCNQTTHWIERDCYDTGKRNHMQRHSNQTTAETREAVVDPEVCSLRTRSNAVAGTFMV